MISAAVLGASGAAAVLTAGAGVAPTAGPSVAVIVRDDGSDAASAAVRRAGGEVGRRLSIVDSFTATVPAGALTALRSAPGVREVTADGQVTLQSKQWIADGEKTPMTTVTQLTGAQKVWGQIDNQGRPTTGKGIGVALIDSGITPVRGLGDSTRVINGPDLSFESQAPNLRYLDTFGHGTHMAGIIAGHDPDAVVGQDNSNPAKLMGVAPDASLINVKVAAADGAVDVSQVIAGIDWVVAHRNDAGLNIRVLNLSFGTDSTQDPRLDPLSHAVEAAWRKGIVVVVAAGNDGFTASRLSMPAMNPYVIAVGAADHMGTATLADDKVASFSTRGSATRAPDLVAPGKSIASLRDPNSYVDVNYPTGMVPGDTAARFFRGSGTSQATAVTSGAAALLLQARPNLTPDQVKRLLTSTAAPMPTADPIGRGAGQLDVKAALNAPTPTTTQAFPASTGTGSLDAARGTAHVADPVTGTELTGERDIMNTAWNATSWAANCLTATTWSGGTWNGSVWAGGAWTGTSWTARTWSGVAWAGADWAGRTWSSTAWVSSVWDGRTWSGRTWSGRTWSGRTWSGGYWSSRLWQ